jgi:hypothetical protein
MFLFWILTWAVSFLLFLLIPLCCVPDNRRRLYFRVTLMKWNVEAEVAQAAAQGNNPTGVTTGAVGASAAVDADHDSNFHYVLSRAQEDEIRESFLAEKLQKYTFVSLPRICCNMLHSVYYRIVAHSFFHSLIPLLCSHTDTISFEYTKTAFRYLGHRYFEYQCRQWW